MRLNYLKPPPDLLEYVRDIETYLKNWGSKA